MRAWKRKIEVVLSNGYSTLKFNNFSKDDSNLDISISIETYMSAYKDKAVVKIRNLTYAQIVQIIDSKYFDVEIFTGYETSGTFSAFKGGVLYVSNERDDVKTSTIYLLCASTLVAKFGQSRLNLSLNSGINLYTAVKYFASAAGIKNTAISTQLKKQILDTPLISDETFATWVEKLCKDNSSFITNSDDSDGSILRLFDSNNSNYRTIRLKSNNILLVSGFPQMTKDGVSFNILPTMRLSPGDVVILDNSLIQTTSKSFEDVQQNLGYYLDENNAYMIYQMNWTLNTRDSSNYISILAKSRNLISSYIGNS